MNSLIKKLKDNLVYEIVVGIIASIAFLIFTGLGGQFLSLLFHHEPEVAQPTETHQISTISDTDIAYSKLEKLAIGISGQNLETIFGVPRVKRPLNKKYTLKQQDGKYLSEELPASYEGFIERIYTDQNFYLQTISTRDDVLVFYSVTSRLQQFTPKLPSLLYSLNQSGKLYPTTSNLRIGIIKFGDLKGYKPEASNVMSPMSQPGYYVESFYFGNPGGFDHYLFSDATAGFGSKEQQDNFVLFDKFLFDNKTNDLMTDSTFINWRQSAIPNSYGVLSGYETYKELLDCVMGNGFAPNAVEAEKLY